MKYYTLEAIVRGKEIKFDKVFDSRNSAIDYMFNYYEKNYVYDVEVDEEIEVNGNKHNVEYVCGDGYRFRVNRVQIA